MPLLDVNGTQVHVTDTGGKGPAVVFGHGLLFSGRMFADQVEALQDRYRCITIDWRGQGRTPPARTGGYDMDTLTNDLVGVIDQLGLERIHYVGLSMGGFVGMRLAARHGHRVRTLTLLDTSAGPEDPEKVARYRLLARIYRVVGMKPVRGQVEPIMFGPTFRADPGSRPRIDAWLADLAAVRRSGMQQAIYGVTDREPIFDEIAAITVPTLVVVGADDVATPVAKAEAIQAGICSSRLEVVEGAGHSSTIEQPAEVTRLLAEFLDEH